jgi:hypothetical protein
MTADGTNLFPHRAVSFICVIFWPRLSYCSNFVSFISENDIIPVLPPHPFPHRAAGYPVLPAQAMGGGTSLLVVGQDGCAQGWVAGWSRLQAGNVVIALHTPAIGPIVEGGTAA